ncbi:hypothetical protein KVV02_007024 [Mortierella alpina]|uniref:Uncharacterized protein n=1 Tax=Mortierella alpina TaxID=64518 RepID=A0A9P8CXV1_MORAP|nr:hypothetical protein KVV02_007024 [Mortierella alpina]
MSSHSSTSKRSPSSADSVPYRSSPWPARFLFMTGIAHTIAGLLIHTVRNPFMEALQAGYVNQHGSTVQRRHAFWFFMGGVNMILMGKLVQWYLSPEVKEDEGLRDLKDKPRDQLQRSRNVVPRELGIWFVGVGIAGAAALPKSGFYLLIAQGLGILLSK